jgi:hypothetical protein
MHHKQPECCLANASVRILHIDVTEDTGTPPTAGHLLLRTARFFKEDGPYALLAAPGLHLLPDRTGAGHACHEAALLL